LSGFRGRLRSGFAGFRHYNNKHRKSTQQQKSSNHRNKKQNKKSANTNWTLPAKLKVVPQQNWRGLAKIWRDLTRSGENSLDLARSQQIRRDLARSGEISPDPVRSHLIWNLSVAVELDVISLCSVVELDVISFRRG
jgi:hypothetical protein